MTAFVADETISFLAQHDMAQPFFAIAGFYAPHPPLNPPQRFVDMYDPDTLPLPFSDESSGTVPWQGMELSNDLWRKVKAYYYALVTHVDDQVGRILRYLEEIGQLDNTLIIFTSDHGEHLGDHGLIQKGPPGLDSCAHIPLLVAYPGVISEGQRFGQLVEAVDIAPTILDFCGVHAPPFFQGRTFRPLLVGHDYQPRQSAYIEFKDPFRSSWKTVRTHDYMYSIFSTDGQSESQGEVLFDLANDPHQQRNVVDDPAYAESLNTLRRELLRRWFMAEDQYPLRSGQY